jgi:signal transduction histidine kinase
MASLLDNGAQESVRAVESAAMAACGADTPCALLTRLVADMLDVPVALLSLPRADEYRFRVNIGLDGFESVPCRISFCAYTMLGTDVLVVPDARIDARFQGNPLVLGAPYIVTYVGVPLVSSRGVTLGTLCAIDYQPRTFSLPQLDQLRGVARIAAWLLESEASSREEQTTSPIINRQAQQGRDVEREQLAIALHEGIAQDLFALRLQLQQLRKSGAWRPEADSAAAAVGAAFTRALDRSIGDVRELANGLLPQGPANLNIVEAIRQHAHDVAEQTGLEIQVNVVGPAVDIDSVSRLLLMRAVRESLANAARQVRACRVSVTFEYGARALRLRVADDGMGGSEDAQAHAVGLGLVNMRERVSAAGGMLRVERNARGGTTVLLELPRAGNIQR